MAKNNEKSLNNQTKIPKSDTIIWDSSNGKQYVVKTSRDGKHGRANQKFERQRIAEIDARTILDGQTHDINIPRIIDSKQGYLITESAPGKQISMKILGQLSNEQVAAYIKNMAVFLNDMHQNTARRLRSSYTVSFTGSIRPIIEFYKESLDYRNARRVERLMTEIKFRRFTSDYTVFTHGDLHPRNIIYDTASNQISIVNFGRAKFAHPNHDAVPYDMSMPDAMMPVLVAIIDHYNGLQKRHPIYYNKLHLQQIYEYGTCAVLAIKAIKTRMHPRAFGKFFRNTILPRLLKLDLVFDTKSQR